MILGNQVLLYSITVQNLYFTSVVAIHFTACWIIFNDLYLFFTNMQTLIPRSAGFAKNPDNLQYCLLYRCHDQWSRTCIAGFLSLPTVLMVSLSSPPCVDHIPGSYVVNERKPISRGVSVTPLTSPDADMHDEEEKVLSVRLPAWSWRHRVQTFSPFNQPPLPAGLDHRTNASSFPVIIAQTLGRAYIRNCDEWSWTPWYTKLPNSLGRELLW